MNDAEVAAFVETDRHLWSKLTMRIDARLRTLGRRETGIPRHHRPLTLRERQVLRGIFEGLTNKQIATDVGVTEGAVKATLQSLFRKTSMSGHAPNWCGLPSKARLARPGMNDDSQPR